MAYGPAPSSFLLGFAQRYPAAPEATAFAVGAWLAVALALTLAWAASRGESWRRAVLGLEDPRIYAMLRVSFAVLAGFMFLNMVPIADLVWSDEGMFTLEEAQRRYGAKPLAGWTAEDGFLGEGGWAGTVHFFTHRPSLLLLHASPAYVRGYLLALTMSLLCFAVGFRTRIAGVVAWLLMNGIYAHNAVFFEGTDTVLRCVWWPLLFARCDAAWSVDAWFVGRTEARRLRAPHRLDVGRLLDRLGHVVVASGLAAVALAQIGQPLWPSLALAVVGAACCVARGAAELRADRRNTTEASPRPYDPLPAVPRFPRLLIMLQIGAIYLSTGLAKTGIVWHEGHALYYAINNIHLARFELGSAWASRLFASNLFRVATWITLAWEIGFPLVLLGQVLRFDERHGDAPWSRHERSQVTRLWLGRVALAGAVVAAFVMARIAYPYMLALGRDDRINDPADELRALTLAWWVIIPAAVAAWQVLGRVRLVWVVPETVARFGALGRRVAGRRLVLDRAFVLRWLLGRRVWLGVGLLFHGLLVLTLNIGMFPFLMIASYLAFFEAEELLSAPVRPIAAARPRLRSFRTGWRPPAPDPRQRLWLRATLVLAPLLVVYARISSGNWNRRTLTAAAVVWLVVLGASGVVALARWVGAPRPADPLDGPAGVGRGPPIMRSQPRRIVVAAFVVLHAITVVGLLLPTHPLFDPWRRPVQRAVMPYAELARLRQGWRMFAPNPPRRSVFMRTVVVDTDGGRTVLGPTFYEDRPALFLINDRRRKMHRRMLSKGKGYLQPWADAHCRMWVRVHGRPPRAVVVERVDVPILPPPGLGDAGEGPAHHRSGAPKVRQVERLSCGEDGAVSLELARRWEVAPPDGEAKAKAKAKADARRAAQRAEDRRRAWENRTRWVRLSR